MKILFLITARGGSKGVPRKNMRQLAGQSLIAWKAHAARGCLLPAEDQQLAITSDDGAMLLEGSRLGAYAIMRPKEFATDDAKTVDVIAHALEQLQHDVYDAVMLLEPSSPFATAGHMLEAIRLYKEMNCDLVVGMRRVEPHPVFVADESPSGWIGNIVEQMQNRQKGYGIALQRQELMPQWTMNGALYLFSVPMFMRTRSIYGGRSYGLLMDRWHSTEIDTEDDFEMARYAVDNKKVSLPWEK